jgi:hypothetical protein
VAGHLGRKKLQSMMGCPIAIYALIVLPIEIGFDLKAQSSKVFVLLRAKDATIQQDLNSAGGPWRRIISRR